MKQSFQIPENCTTVTVEQVENKIVCTFEEKFIPKCGDICTSVGGGICIYKEEGSLQPIVYCGIYNGKVYYDTEDFTVEMRRLATESEKQTLLDALAKDGKKWNAELKRVEKLRWRAAYGKGYYYVLVSMGCASVYDNIDRRESEFSTEQYNSGNYFKTEQQAQAVADRINAIFAEQL